MLRFRQPLEPPHPTITRIIAQVASTFGIEPEALLGQSHERRFAWPRQIAMYLAHKGARFSTTHVARRFNKRDHTTVLTACRRVQSYLASAVIDDPVRLLCARLSTSSTNPHIPTLERVAELEHQNAAYRVALDTIQVALDTCARQTGPMALKLVTPANQPTSERQPDVA